MYIKFTFKSTYIIWFDNFLRKIIPIINILSMFVLLFGTVDAHGDLFVRSAKVFQVKIVWWWLPPCANCKVLAQSQLSCKNNGRVFHILNCSHWHAWEARAELYQLGMTFVWVIISNSTDVGIILMLHKSSYARPYFWRRSLYGV